MMFATVTGSRREVLDDRDEVVAYFRVGDDAALTAFVGSSHENFRCSSTVDHPANAVFAAMLDVACEGVL